MMSTSKKSITILLFLFLSALGRSTVIAQGHYSGASFNPNDYFVPPVSGWALSLYYSYSSMNYYNAAGSKSEIIQVSQNPPVNISLEQKVKTQSVIPMIIYFGKQKVLNANWGIMVLPLFNSPNATVALDFYTGQNLSGSQDININSFGFGDLLIQPLWLTWEKEKMATEFSYGIWLPTGKYEANDPENVGSGYTSHNFRLAQRFKPSPRIGTIAAVTFEVNSKQKDVDFTEAPHLTLDLGSSYSFTGGHELGLMTFGSWQTGEDEGTKSTGENDRIYGFGAYCTYYILPGKLSVLTRAVQNLGARSRYSAFAFQIGFNYLLLK